MSQNNLSHPVINHAGLAVHKASLQLPLAGRDHVLPNTPAGHRRLLLLLGKLPGAHVVCEASGGYERAVVAVLHQANVPVSVLNPARARHFAQALGQRVKTDPLDARLLAAYGQALTPASTPPPAPAQQALCELTRYRATLLAQLVDLAPRTRTSGCATKKAQPKWQRHKASMAGDLTRSSSAKSLRRPAKLARSRNRSPATWGGAPAAWRVGRSRTAAPLLLRPLASARPNWSGASARWSASAPTCASKGRS